MGKRNRRRKSDVMSGAIAQIVGTRAQKSVSGEIATRQRSVDFYSILQNLPNPDPVLRKRNQSIKVYTELAYDSRVRACTSSRKAPIKAMEWLLIGEDVPEPVMAFYQGIFDTYNMTDLFSETLDAWLYGYKPIEIIWGVVDNHIVPVKFVGKPPAWFCYDDENRLRFITKENMISGELVDPKKFIVARNEPTYENPYGIPVMSACFWPVTFRRTGLRFFTQFVEKYGCPFLLAHAEEGAQEERIKEMAAQLDDMVQDAIAVVPKGWDVKLLEAAEGKGQMSSLHQNYLDVMNNEISLSILGTNLTTEVKGGSYAASQSHMTVRDDIIEGDAFVVEQAMNELIALTHSYNFIGQPMPMFKLFREEAVDEMRSKRDLNLTKAGVRFNKSYYQRAYSLTEEEFEVKEPAETLATETETADVV